MVGAVLIFLSFALNFLPPKLEKLQLDMESSTLHKGKKVSLKAKVYYRQNGSLLVTHATFPTEKVTRTTGLGEFFEYDVKNNTVLHLMGKEVSSRYSVFHAFFNGSINDMGLTDNGFALKKTRIEKKLVITEWEPTQKENKKMSKAELVHENHLPVYLAFFDLNNQPIQKSYYSNYQPIGNILFPCNLTEFEYVGTRDSIITRRKYKNPVVNQNVSDQWFNFQVPASAKVLQSPK